MIATRFGNVIPGSVITDFDAVAGEVLDYSSIFNSFTSYDGSNPFDSGHLRLVQSGTDVLLEYDLNGATGGASFTTWATLEDTDLTDITTANLNPGFDPFGP